MHLQPLQACSVQVLRSVCDAGPQHCTNELFSAPPSPSSTSGACSTSTGACSTAAQRAVHLPHDLLARWLAAAAPEIDLRGAKMPQELWSKLLSCMSLMPSGAVQTLHVPLGNALDAAALETALRELRRNSTGNRAHCLCTGGHNINQVPTHWSVGSSTDRGCGCHSGGWMCAAQNAPIFGLSSPASDCIDEIQQFLSREGKTAQHQCSSCLRRYPAPVDCILLGSQCQSCHRFASVRNAPRKPIPQAVWGTNHEHGGASGGQPSHLSLIHI